MRVIITGGSGLIGSALAAELSHHGYEVIVLTRRPGGDVLPSGARTVQWDGRTADGWGNWVEAGSVIVNLAGEAVAGRTLLETRWTPERKQRILQSRLDAGRAVTAAVRAASRATGDRPAVVIQASAVGYYGPRPEARISEQASPGSDFLASVCQAWEASTATVETWGVRRVVARIGVVLSRHGGALERQKLPFLLFAGGPLGSGQQGYPWIALPDVAGALSFLIENPQAQGAFNLCAPTPVTNGGFGRALAQVLHRPYWLPAPALAFRLAFGEAATILLEGQMAYPERLLALGYTFRYPDLLPALDAVVAGR